MDEHDDVLPPEMPLFESDEEALAWLQDWAARNPDLLRRAGWRRFLSSLSRHRLAAELGLDPSRLTRADRERIRHLRCDRGGKKLGMSPEAIEHMKKANLPWPASPGFYHPPRRPARRPFELLPLPAGVPADPTVPQIFNFLHDYHVQMLLAEGYTLEEIAAAFEEAERDLARCLAEDDVDGST
jgi:hypothetical protein